MGNLTGSSGSGSTSSGASGWETAGNVVNMLSDFAGAMNRNKELRFSAKQYEQKAETARAIGTRAMRDMRQAKRSAISSMTAQIAGGGAGADPSTARLQARVASKIEFGGLMQKYMKDTEAQSLDLQAKAMHRQAKIAKGVGLGKVLNSVLGMFSKG